MVTRCTLKHIRSQLHCFLVLPLDFLPTRNSSCLPLPGAVPQCNQLGQASLLLTAMQPVSSFHYQVGFSLDKYKHLRA